MSTKTTEKPTTKNEAKKATAKKATATKISVTSSKSDATLKEAKETVNALLRPNGKTVVKKLQHAQILAEKFEKMSKKYDELTHFMAGKDNDNASMKFASESNYSFTLLNPAVISKVLTVVEQEFSNHLEKAEKELVTFKI